jgi:cation transport ATPase
VAFVGDGTNDAAALAAADVSIALSSGSDVAIHSASFILLNSNLQTVLELITLAKRVFWRVKANFVWASVYNLALVPVAAGVFYPVGNHWRLGPVWASAAMAASSVSVVSSSLALKLPPLKWSRGVERGQVPNIWGRRP